MMDNTIPKAGDAPPWMKYEDLARKVVDDMREALGLALVEGKQRLTGASGNDWEIDAIAYLSSGDGFLIVEARRKTAAGVSAEAVAAISRRMKDVGADGAVIVSPLPLQRGGRKLADFDGIQALRLDLESTPERYLAEYMGRVFLGASILERVDAGADASAMVGWAKNKD